MGCEPTGSLMHIHTMRHWPARGQWPLLIVLMGPLKPNRPKVTKQGGRGGPNEGIQGLEWEVVKACVPGCKARRTQKQLNGSPSSEGAGNPKSPAPTVQRVHTEA